jgi:hypothetical protein
MPESASLCDATSATEKVFDILTASLFPLFPLFGSQLLSDILYSLGVGCGIELRGGEVMLVVICESREGEGGGGLEMGRSCEVRLEWNCNRGKQGIWTSALMSAGCEGL